ncbi:Prophenoloxidase 2 [Carabus blaptoides fortunei]
MSNKKDLLLLFDRPKEPVFIAKGDDRAAFQVPENFLESRFKPIGVQLFSRFGSEARRQISVNDIAIPDITEVAELTRYENFSLFIPKHRRIAGRLIEIFIGVRNVEDLKSVAVYSRDRLNPYLFNYALAVALLHRPDTRDLDVPSFMTSFPDKFVDGTVLQQAKEEAEIIPEGSRMPIVIPRDYTASDAEPEHRLAYFREDLGVNLHHWHWHLVYPHSERLIDFRKPIPEAYFPKLDSLVSSRGWPARVSNQTMANINRESDQVKIDIDDLLRWRDRIYAAIHSTSVMGSNGQQIPLTEFGGIDVLGNIVEACSLLSPNPNFYGQLHNMGHVFMSFIHDPDGRHLESFGVIGDSATAMRDPAFYKWHAFIDDMFQEHKQTLPAYTGPQLNYQGVTVTDVKVNVDGGKTNEFSTFWMQSDVDLSRGMDFTPRGSVFARFTHLNHRPFSYNIQVANQGNQRMGTCRIFLGPKNDESGRAWLLRDQRLLMVELDRFTVTLRQGVNTIVRRSTDSSVTIPFERTFRDLDTQRPAEGDDALAEFNFCGCGWPQHMLLPRGTPEGYPCQLFVMISNYEDDKVEQNIEGRCNDAYAFCGIKDRLYPDRRPMGFPFDRIAAAGVDTMAQFLTPNMRVQDVNIKFNDTVEYIKMHNNICRITTTVSHNVIRSFARKAAYRKRTANPGIDKRIRILEEKDEISLQNIDVEELESDFMKLGDVHRQHEKELKYSKEKEKYWIVRQKYFKENKVNFLTWNDKEQIRYLHETNPSEWTIYRLSEGFPALPETIVKILKAKWQKSTENKQFNHDKAVERNWNLLREGKLSNELPENLVLHLKKFSSRKHETMASSTKCIVNTSESQQTGEFASIIKSYKQLKHNSTLEETRANVKNEMEDNERMLGSGETPDNKSVTLSQLKRNIVAGKQDEMLLKDIFHKETGNGVQQYDVNKHTSTKTELVTVDDKNKQVELLTYPQTICIPKDKYKKGLTYKQSEAKLTDQVDN